MLEKEHPKTPAKVHKSHLRTLLGSSGIVAELALLETEAADQWTWPHQQRGGSSSDHALQLIKSVPPLRALCGEGSGC
eukprot:4856482-Amphidinium_carterae.1